MNSFIQPLTEYSVISDLKGDIMGRKLPVRVTGCIDAQKSNLIAAVSSNVKRRLIIAENDQKAREIAADYSLYDRNVMYYPAKDVIFFSADIRGNTIVSERLKVIKRLLSGNPITVVTEISAGMDKLSSPERIKSRIIHIDGESEIDIDELAAELVANGYTREALTENPGQFAIRGGIIDIFPVTDENPVRIELWGDSIDCIKSFDATSQRSIENIDSVDIFPAAEIVLSEFERTEGLKKIEKDADRLAKKFTSAENFDAATQLRRTVREFGENLEYLGGNVGVESYIDYFTKDIATFFSYFDNEDSVIFLDEPQRLNETAKAVETEFAESMKGRLEKGYIVPGQAKAIIESKALMAQLAMMDCVLMSTMEYRFQEIPVKKTYSLNVISTPSYAGNFEMLVGDLLKWKKRKYRIILVAASKSRAVRLAEDLREREITAFFSDDEEHILKPTEVMIVSGALQKGFEYPLLSFAVISEIDLFGAKKTKKKNRVKYDGDRIKSLSDLNVGDYVVHENYGVGIYRGIEKIEINNVIKDYINVEYADGGTLHVLATSTGMLQKFAGGDTAKAPKLNRLDSGEWKKTKTKVQSAVCQIAGELVKLYALRQASSGHVFDKDNEWQKQFEDSFPFEETEDQLKAIEDTKRDMESPRIMDRLVCGDVGFGKTEIAIRAAFKAVQDSMQVAVLVPTTILAQQHYNTFTQRMHDFPVHIEMISRFRTAAEQKKIIADTKAGRIDILIGTHRILSKDVDFKKLGLLIVDEEQRFGVTHKEKIKQMRGNVDVLTLTATPIPRTLHMSLSGIRDMSVLDEPPVDRLPIQTFVMEHNDEIIREAINREMARGGQVYYVNSRIAGIDDVAQNIQSLVPEANVVYAHGRMSEHDLESIMFSFVNGDIDVLVSTTIIETGLDISNVNTIIIDDADRFGLSQLYQLRGRVGRSNRTAYAFMMYRRDKILKEEAKKRLEAIKEFTELGSGIKIAMRDLEIRGAGNLLGAEQSGHMEAVGYDLYCKMLNQAVRTLKLGEDEAEVYNTSIDLDMDAYIPPTYIRNELQKLDMYKRIATIDTEEAMMDIEEELTDRYGELPPSVMNLIKIALLKAQGHEVYVTSIVQKHRLVKIDFYEKAKLDVAQFPALLDSYGDALRMIPGKVPRFELTLRGERGNASKAIPEQSVLDQIGELFTRLHGLLPASAQLHE